MTKPSIVFLFLLLFSSTVEGQSDINSLFQKLDSLMQIKEFVVAQPIFEKLSKSPLNKNQTYKLNEYEVERSRYNGDKLRQAEAMVKYLENTTFDSVLMTMDKRDMYSGKNDKLNIYRLKSSYSRSLVHFYINENQPLEAQKYLRIHESKFLAFHPCGNGLRTDRVRRKIFHGSINQSLGNYESVLIGLLPFASDETLWASSEKEAAEIDSLLMLAIKTKYSKQEIYKEFKKCLSEISTDDRPEKGYIIKVKIFGVEFENSTIESLAQRKARKLDINKIKEARKREEARNELFVESYRNEIKNMRIYKELVSSN